MATLHGFRPQGHFHHALLVRVSQGLEPEERVWRFPFSLNIKDNKDFMESMRRAEATVETIHSQQKEGVSPSELEPSVVEFAYHVKSVLGPMLVRHKLLVPRALALEKLSVTKAGVIQTTTNALSAYEAAVMAITRAYRGPGQGEMGPQLLQMVNDAVARVEGAIASEERRRDEKRKREGEKERLKAEKEQKRRERIEARKAAEARGNIEADQRRLEYLEKRKAHLEESIRIERNRRRLEEWREKEISAIAGIAGASASGKHRHITMRET